MTIRIRFRQGVAVSSSIAEEKDLGNSESQIVVDTLGEGGAMRFTIPASAVDLNVQHPQVATAKYLYLRAVSKDPANPPVELMVKRNGSGNTAWPLTPVDGKEAVMQVSTSGLTSLLVSNPGSVAMDLTVAMAGD
jgi:hypothetical protein